MERRLTLLAAHHAPADERVRTLVRAADGRLAGFTVPFVSLRRTHGAMKARG
jgi:hypothetical protein